MALQESPSDWIPEETFGDRLLMLRRHLKLTTDQIAARTGVPGPTWNTWENGASPRQMEHKVAQIADALKVDRAWLMWGSRSR